MADSPLSSDPGLGPDHGSPPGTPRWVKVSGILGLAVVLLIVIMLLTGLGGPHGPTRHLAGFGGQMAPASATEQVRQP